AWGRPGTAPRPRAQAGSVQPLGEALPRPVTAGREPLPMRHTLPRSPQMPRAWQAACALLLGLLGPAGPAGAATRTYHLGVVEEYWDYVPQGKNVVTGRGFSEDNLSVRSVGSRLLCGAAGAPGVAERGRGPPRGLATLFLERGPNRIGGLYKKAVYRHYTDASYSTEIPKPPWLGFLGPILRAEVGDVVVIHLKNFASRPYSLHPHGVFYNKDSEGALYPDGTSGHNKDDDRVPPGGNYTYVWPVREEYAPAPADANCLTWVYHSHIDAPKDICSGLIGPLLVCKEGVLHKHSGARTDVDREFVIMFTLVDENQSWYLDENIQHFCTDPASVDKGDPVFQRSNKMHGGCQRPQREGRRWAGHAGQSGGQWPEPRGAGPTAKRARAGREHGGGDTRAAQGRRTSGLCSFDAQRGGDASPRASRRRRVQGEPGLPPHGELAAGLPAALMWEPAAALPLCVCLLAALNGYLFGNFPEPEMCVGESVSWHLFGMGNEIDIHSIYFYGNTFLSRGHRTDVVSLFPATFLTAEMAVENPGKWLITCQVSDHLQAGMLGQYNVGHCQGHAPRPALRGQQRRYFISAEKVLWDYAPQGYNKFSGLPLNASGRREPEGAQRGTPARRFPGAERARARLSRLLSRSDSELYFAQGDARIGGRYWKARFAEYADASFTRRKSLSEAEAHLGILGPVIRAEVGDTLLVTFANRADRAYSILPHGVMYDKVSDAAPNMDGFLKPGAHVRPGETFVYRWTVPDSVGPTADDPPCLTYLYFSAVDPIKDTSSGLVGPLLVCKEGALNADGSQKDIDREFYLLFTVFDENLSRYLDENIQKFTWRPLSVDKEDKDFVKSNRMHAINGYMYGNQPGLHMCKKDRVSWHLLGLGTDTDMHGAYFQGNTLQLRGTHRDSLALFPHVSTTAFMQPDRAGEGRAGASDWPARSEGGCRVVLGSKPAPVVLHFKRTPGAVVFHEQTPSTRRGSGPGWKDAELTPHGPGARAADGSPAGIFRVFCSTLHHFARGMSQIYEVASCGNKDPPEQPYGMIRTFYIAAEEVEWDYAPNKNWEFEKQHLDAGGERHGDIFMNHTENWIGSQYKKVVYREYTDGGFVEIKARPPREQHLELLARGSEQEWHAGSCTPPSSGAQPGRVGVLALGSGRSRREAPGLLHPDHWPGLAPARGASGGTAWGGAGAQPDPPRPPHSAGEAGLELGHGPRPPGACKRRAESSRQSRVPTGPMIHAEVGDSVLIVFKNKARRPYSIAAQGVEDVDSGRRLQVPATKPGRGARVRGAACIPSGAAAAGTELAGHEAGRLASDAPCPSFAPGEVRTYRWNVPKRSGPGPSDPNCIPWVYYSTVDFDTYSGLVGPLIACREGVLDARGRRADVDYEFVLLFLVFNENESWYLEDNIRKYLNKDPRHFERTQDFEESNRMHAINGKIFGNLHGLVMSEDSMTNWYLLGLGSEVDIHTVHYHAESFLFKVRGRPPRVGRGASLCRRGRLSLMCAGAEAAGLSPVSCAGTAAGGPAAGDPNAGLPAPPAARLRPSFTAGSVTARETGRALPGPDPAQTARSRRVGSAAPRAASRPGRSWRRRNPPCRRGRSQEGGRPAGLTAPRLCGCGLRLSNWRGRAPSPPRLSPPQIDKSYREDVYDLFPGTFQTIELFADHPGTWLLHCHVSDHIHAGMETTYTVLRNIGAAGRGAGAQLSPGSGPGWVAEARGPAGWLRRAGPRGRGAAGGGDGAPQLGRWRDGRRASGGDNRTPYSPKSPPEEALPPDTGPNGSDEGSREPLYFFGRRLGPRGAKAALVVLFTVGLALLVTAVGLALRLRAAGRRGPYQQVQYRQVRTRELPTDVL
ncbi:Hephaestin-like protein 1, partial [Galemys pyrenaicus]